MHDRERRSDRECQDKVRHNHMSQNSNILFLILASLPHVVSFYHILACGKEKIRYEEGGTHQDQLVNVNAPC